MPKKTTDWKKYEPGPDLDKIAAKEVMGWDLTEHEFGADLPGGPFRAFGYDEDGRRIISPEGFPRFSTDMTAAWLLVEKIREKMDLYIICHRDTTVVQYGFYQNTVAHHKLAPYAICLAALEIIERMNNISQNWSNANR